MHNGLQRTKALTLSEGAEQTDAIQHIQGISQQPLIAQSLTSHSLNKIGRIAIIFQLRLDALPQQKHEVCSQGMRLHLEIRELLLPDISELTQQSKEIKRQPQIPKDLENAVTRRRRAWV